MLEEDEAWEREMREGEEEEELEEEEEERRVFDEEDDERLVWEDSSARRMTAIPYWRMSRRSLVEAAWE